MRFVLVALVLAHGLIHLLGFARAFHLAEVPGLSGPVSRPQGIAWLAAAALFGATATLLAFGREPWWVAGGAAVVLSQVVIVLSWRDARFGTVANVLVLVPVLLSALEARPASYGNRYRAAAREALARGVTAPLVTEADIAHLPPPVQRYLRVTGALGRPVVRSFRAAFSGEFRNGPDAAWMRFRSEQVDTFEPPERLFLMRASRFGVPMEGLHVFGRAGATMQIRVASLLQVVDARGPQMDRGETVTLLNDICLIAPSALLDERRLRWEAVGPLSARAVFAHRGNTVSALLTFDEAGELVDFVSNDRFMSSDGKGFANLPWSTPVREYREVDGRKVAAYAETVWQTAEGPFVYARFRLQEVAYNPTGLEAQRAASRASP